MAKPSVRCHAPLSVTGGLLQRASISWCKSSCLLSRTKRCLLFGGSVYISYIGGSASVKPRCPLLGASPKGGSTVYVLATLCIYMYLSLCYCMPLYTMALA